MIDAMRERFEAWWRDYNASIGVEMSDFFLFEFVFERDEDGHYERMGTQNAWDVWKGALEHAGRITCQIYGHEFEGCGECTPPAPVVPGDAFRLIHQAGNALNADNRREAIHWLHELHRCLLNATPELPKGEQS